MENQIMASVEAAIRAIVSNEVNNLLTQRLKAIVDQGVRDALNDQAYSMGLATHKYVVQAISDRLNSPSSFATMEQVQEAISNRLDAAWDDDLEDRVDRKIESHVEDEHDEDTFEEAANEAAEKTFRNLDSNDQFRRLVRDVISEDVEFRIEVR